MSNIVEDALSILGYRVGDKVTGCEGVADYIGFDLYGCIQVSINRGFDSDGKRQESYWFDYNRLQVLSDRPVMEQPEFVDNEQPVEYKQSTGTTPGPAHKAPMR